MSVDDVNPSDAYRVEAPPKSGVRGGSLAGRALLIVFGFFAALATVVVLVMATLSQMQWQRAPEDLHEKYLPARATPVPPANRTPTPSDVGDVDPNAVGAPNGQQQQQFRPGLAPGFPAAGSADEPQQQFTPSFTPAPGPGPVRPAPRTDAPATEQTPTPVPSPRAAVRTPEPPPAKGAEYRRVAGKTFKLQDDGFLVDTSYHDGMTLPVVQVTAGGPEYANLLASHRELAQFFRLSDRLVLVSGDVVYRVVP